MATGGTAASGGTAGAPSTECSALCGGATCAPLPACLPEAYGPTTASTLSICIPRTNLVVATVCDASTCNGSAGCELNLEIGPTGWTLAASGTTGITNATLDTVITGITGSLDVTGMWNCSLEAVVPVAGLPVVANGTVQAVTGLSDLTLAFEPPLDAPLSGLDVSSSVADCKTAAAGYLSIAKDSIRAAILDALNQRAAQLRCLDCRGGCDEHLACVAR